MKFGNGFCRSLVIKWSRGHLQQLINCFNRVIEVEEVRLIGGGLRLSHGQAEVRNTRKALEEGEQCDEELVTLTIPEIAVERHSKCVCVSFVRNRGFIGW